MQNSNNKNNNGANGRNQGFGALCFLLVVTTIEYWACWAYKVLTLTNVPYVRHARHCIGEMVHLTINVMHILNILTQTCLQRLRSISFLIAGTMVHYSMWQSKDYTELKAKNINAIQTLSQHPVFKLFPSGNMA